MPALVHPALRLPYRARHGTSLAETHPLDDFADDAETKDDLDAVLSWEGRVDQKATTTELSCVSLNRSRTTSCLTPRRPTTASLRRTTFRRRRMARRVRATGNLHELAVFLAAASFLVVLAAWLVRH